MTYFCLENQRRARTSSWSQSSSGRGLISPLAQCSLECVCALTMPVSQHTVSNHTVSSDILSNDK